MRQLAPLPSYVFKRKSIYYYRIRVPFKLKSLVLRDELRVSLRTSYKRLAQKRASALTVALNDLFSELIKNPMSYSEEKIRQVLQAHTNEQLNNDETYRRDNARTWDDVDLESSVVSDQLERYSNVLQLNQYRTIEPEVDRLILENKIEVSKGSDEYRFLCREFAKSQLAMFSTVMDRSDGIYSAETSSASNDQTQSKKSQSITSVTFQELVDRYVAEADLTKQWREKTKEENIKIYTLFIRIIGDINLGDLSHEVVVQYKDTLKLLPPHLNTKPQYKDKSIEEVLAMPDLPQMSVETINKNIRRVSALFKWATQHGMMQQNYAEGLSLKKSKRPDQERDTYTKDELNIIFNENPVYTNGEFNKPFKFWLPLIGLFTGARQNEICQLYLEDIQQDEKGTWFIDINVNTEDKKLKSLSSGRQVALHPVVLDAGLIEYVTTLKSRGETRLFPELTLQKGSYGKAASKWYTALRKKLDIYRKGLDFHSFRHTFSNNLHEQGVSLDIIGEIVGHDEGKVTQRYAKRLSPTGQLKHLEKLNFDLDLTRIVYE